MSKHQLDIIRFLKWRKKAKDKTINIRLYEIIYVGVLMLWSKKNRPPIENVIYQFITRDEYEKELASGKLFEKLLLEIRETPCEDNSGYYLENSSEYLNFKEYKKLIEAKNKLIKKLSTKKRVSRYTVILEICKEYNNWAINKKKEDLEDITKIYNFETTSRPPMEI